MNHPPITQITQIRGFAGRAKRVGLENESAENESSRLLLSRTHFRRLALQTAPAYGAYGRPPAKPRDLETRRRLRNNLCHL
jgi:hypothetical protein